MVNTGVRETENAGRPPSKLAMSKLDTRRGVGGSIRPFLCVFVYFYLFVCLFVCCFFLLFVSLSFLLFSGFPSS